MAMNPHTEQHSWTWITFTYASFIVSLAMVAVAIIFLPADIAITGYLAAMGVAMLVQSCITLTKTIRDVHENARLVNRIEDANTERLLMEIDRAK
jgi:hypothetical protein